MKITIILGRKDAMNIIGKIVKEKLVGSAAEGLEVASVEWTTYSSTIVVELSAPDAVE